MLSTRGESGGCCGSQTGDEARILMEPLKMGYTCFDDDICCCLGFIFSNSAFPLFLLPLILYLFWSRGTWKQTQWKIGKWTPIYNDFMTSGVSYADNIVKSHRHTTWTPYTYLYTCISSPVSGWQWDVRIDPVTTTKKESTTASYSLRRTTKENKATVAFRSVCCHITYCRLRSLAEFTIYGVCF